MADAEQTVQLQNNGPLECSVGTTLASHFSSSLIEEVSTLDSDEEGSRLEKTEGKESCAKNTLVKEMHSKGQVERQQTSSNGSTPSPVDKYENRSADPDSPVLIEFSSSTENVQNISSKSWWKLEIGSDVLTADLQEFHQGLEPPSDGRSWILCTSEEFQKLDSESSKSLTNTFKAAKPSKELPNSEITDDELRQQNDLNPSPEETSKISCPKRPSLDVENVPPPDANKKWLRYTRDQLLMLMCAPASKVWPEYFDITFKKSEGKIDLEKWMRFKQDGKTSDWSVPPEATATITSGRMTFVTNGITNTSIAPVRASETDTKRSKDPRERIKQEDQIRVVLSPQRKSFSTGCHVSQQGPSFNLGSGSEGNIDRSRELPVNRRIGSGRIPRREDHEQINQSDSRRDRECDKDMEQRRDHKGWRSKNDGGGRFDRDDRHLDKRRRFFDEEDKRSERRDSYRDRRYDHRRTSIPKDPEEETPEWYTGGPSSQNEFIELVGFDEPEKEENLVNGKPKRERRRLRREREGGSGKSSRCTTPVIIEQEEPIEHETKRQENVNGAQMVEPANPIVVEPPDNDPDQDVIQFNVEDYLGSILNIGSEEIFQGNSGGASRLKQFFNSRDSPVEERYNSNSQSRRSSPGKDNFPHVGNLLGFAEPVIRIPSPSPRYDSSHFFAPISPADKTNGESLVDMLQKANCKKINQQPGSGRLPPPSIKDLLMGGKGQSLEEIEASLRKGPSMCVPPPMNRQSHGFNVCKPSVQQPHSRQNQINNPQNPFNDFLSQLSEGQWKGIADAKRENENILAKLLKDGNSSSGPMGNKPSMPNNAATESELIARLMKCGSANINPGNMNPALSSMNMPQSRPPVINMNLPSHTLNPNHVSSSLPQHSPSRSHMLSQTHQTPLQQQQSQQHSSTNNSEMYMKLVQNQQMQQKKQQQQQQQHMLHPGYQSHTQHDPIKQLLGGMNNLGLVSQQNQEHLTRDVQNLFQRVANGQITDTQLIAQLNSGNLNHSQRETVATVLKMMTCHHNANSLMPPRANLTPSPTPQAMISGGLSLGNATASLSPRVASPNPEAAGMLAPHMMQQARVSPLMFGGSAAPLRTPSHQELVVHAQSILQKALLKNELERAKEKHRKREAERTRSPNPAVNSMQNGPPHCNANALTRTNQDGSPTKGTKCQSPLAFTPISVLRKMTAEKDRADKDKLEGYNLSEAEKSRDAHNRMSNHHNSNMHHGLNVKDKKIHKVPSPLPSGNSMLGPRAQMVMSGAPTTPMMNLASHPSLLPPQRHISMQSSMPIGRANLHHNANNIRVMQHAQQQHQHQHQHQQQQQQQQAQQMMRNLVPHLNSMNHPSIHNRMPNTHNTMQHLMMGNNNNYKPGEASLNVPPRPVGSQSNSPINNFMNFFGRDMIAKVQAGAMPDLPGGKALSLEEVERQHTQAVPN